MVLTAALASALLGQAMYNPKGPQIEVVLDSGKKFTITTDTKNYPKTVKGISALVNKKFYDGIIFHRVEGWVVQWGDPVSKKGLGDPSIGSNGTGKNLPFESGVCPFTRGSVGIASTGAGLGGDCQLFVITRDAPHLYGGYAALGKVTKGMDVVDSIKIGTKIKSMRIVKK